MSRRGRLFRLPALMAVFSIVAGVCACAETTSILLRVSSPTLVAPTEIDTLEFSIRGQTTGIVVDRSFSLASGWPHTLSIRPGPMEAAAVDVTVRGRLSGALVDEEVVSAAFVRGSDIVVEVVLGDAPPRDAGAPDAGVRDAGPLDAGARDAEARDTGEDAPTADAPATDAVAGDSGCRLDEACDDAVACTLDTCVAGGCLHTPDDTFCAVGSTCDPTTGCPPRVCASSAECDDGRFCNGAETCDGATMACVAGTTPCDDLDACTDDACDESADACAHTTRDADRDGAGDSTCPAVGGVPATDCDDTRADIAPGEPDVCDGLDNDCAGGCDTASTCCRGAIESCMTTCGSMGSRTCGPSCAFSVCSPPAETCNGLDDDCNGACDDGLGCCAGSVGSCVTACGSTGTRSCGADCVPGTCNPPIEACNGADEDCDMQVDEGFECQIGRTRACTTACGSTGIQACSATCTWATCTPPVEACNGVDDNCDMVIDEGCGACSACTGATTISGSGGRFMVNLASSSTTGSCGGAGNEGALTFTIPSPSDVFITTHAAAIDTAVYVRSCTCTGSEVGCNDDADGLATSTLRLVDLPAGTYNVFVDTEVAMSRTVPVDVYISAPGMPSDRCGDPTFIPAGAASVTGNTCGYTNDYDLVNVAGAANCEFSGGGDAPERVYYFYLPTARTVTVGGCNPATLFDSAIYFRSVCSDGTAGAQLGCNDDGCTGSRTCDRSLRSSKTVTIGPGLFYLVIDGYSGGGSTCPCGAYGFSLTGF